MKKNIRELVKDCASIFMGLNFAALYICVFIYGFAWLDKEYNTKKIYQMGLQADEDVREIRNELQDFKTSIMPSAFKGRKH